MGPDPFSGAGTVLGLELAKRLLDRIKNNKKVAQKVDDIYEVLQCYNSIFIKQNEAINKLQNQVVQSQIDLTKLSEHQKVVLGEIKLFVIEHYTKLRDG